MSADYLTIEAKARELALKEAPGIVDDLAKQMENAAGGRKLSNAQIEKIRERAKAAASDPEHPALFSQFLEDIISATERGEIKAFNPRTYAPAPNPESVKGRAHYYVVKGVEVDAWYSALKPRSGSIDGQRLAVHMAAEMLCLTKKESGAEIKTNRAIAKELEFRGKLKKSNGDPMDADTIRKHLNKSGDLPAFVPPK